MLKVRNAQGDMVPLATMITVKDITGPAIVNHYNQYPSAEINGNPAPGSSSGQAIRRWTRSPNANCLAGWTTSGVN